MRAMVLRRPASIESSPLHLEQVQDPWPLAGEIRLRVRCCALCHTDLHVVEGDLPQHRDSVIPGHQIVGVVDQVGQGVRLFREGDRVGVPWLYATDGSCDFCRRSQENLCERARFTGYDVNGGYAEYTIVSESFAYAIPKQFDDEHAAPLLCAGIIGYRSYRLSGAQRGDRLGLYGFGASAHIVLQFARHLGCEVYVFTRSSAHRELAKRLGASWTGAAEDRAPASLDAAIIFAPAGGLVPLALGALRKGGTVAMAGIVMSPIPQLSYEITYHERVLRSVANSTRQDAREFLELASQVPVRTEVETFPLEQANEALRRLKHSEIEGAGVLKI